MSETIVDRLRCRYARGPIMPNGEPESGWRDFSGPALEGMTLPTPLMLEAAETIAAKDAEIARLRSALKKCAAVLAGETRHKGGLIDALESANAALTQQEQV